MISLKYKFSEEELELIELLKKKEMTRKEIKRAGFPFSVDFFTKCSNNGIMIYESDETGNNQKFGVLA